jgi:hypothetical protein
VYFNYFDIKSSKNSLSLFENIKLYNIVFLHTQASNKEIDLDSIVKTYNDNDKYIIICANKNVYQKNHKYYEISQLYVNIYISYYIDIIKNAKSIYVIDSCFSCIVYPLLKTNRLVANIVEIIER